MKTTDTIRTNFELFQKRKGLTIQKIAKQKGVTRQTIYSYFRQGITLKTIEKIAELVGVEPWELLKPIEAEPTTDPGPTCPHCGKPIQITINKPGNNTPAHTPELF